MGMENVSPCGWNFTGEHIATKTEATIAVLRAHRKGLRLSSIPISATTSTASYWRKKPVTLAAVDGRVDLQAPGHEPHHRLHVESEKGVALAAPTPLPGNVERLYLEKRTMPCNPPS